LRGELIIVGESAITDVAVAGARWMAGARRRKMTKVIDGRPLGRRERKKAERRAAIISVARQAFQISGFDGVSMEAIADSADISSATLYNYFPSKSEILYSVLLEDFSHLSDKITYILNARDVPLRSQLVQMIEIYFYWFEEYDRLLIRQVASDAIRSPQINGKIYHQIEKFMIMNLLDLLNRMIDCNYIGEDIDIENSARLLFNIGNSEFYAFISDESISVEQTMDRIGSQIDLVITGIT